MTSTITATTARELAGDHWLNRREAAKYLGIGYQTLANNKDAGPAYSKFFGSVRYRLDDLNAWAKARQVNR